MAKKPRDPFDVSLTKEQRQELAIWLTDEIRLALDARSGMEREVEYWHVLYEQARTRLARTAPWPDAADLTSYLGAEKVDALHARLMRTIWVEPVWTVEGWADSAQRAPFVEEFHQWQAEEERLQSVLDRLALVALIEPRALLEVREGVGTRVTRQEIRAALELDPLSGLPIFDAQGQPILATDVNGAFVEATGEEPSAQAVVDRTEPMRTGPEYRVLSYRDSLMLPGHARDREDIWGYGKRLYKRIPEIRERAMQGVYDKDAVSQLTDVGDREQDPALDRAKQGIATQEGPTAEKELWELLFLRDLDGRGERWYLATVHVGQQVLLRLQYDDLDRARFVPVILFPRPDRATEGFSLIGHKLITVIEEHTAWRNMIADRASLAVNAPIKRVTGALWDPMEQPWGPKAVIDVRDMNELQAVEVPDVPQSAFQREQEIISAAERIAGINDVALGVQPEQQRTLGEVNLVAGQSAVRMELVIKRFQEAMEDLAQIRHAIWKRVLAERGDDGMEMPQPVLAGLESRGMAVPGGRITAALLEGHFRFKPRGSVETADLDRQQYYFVSAMQALPGLVQAFPMIAAFLQAPQAARAMLDQYLRVFRFQNKQAFLGPAPLLADQGLGVGLEGELEPEGGLEPGGSGLPVPRAPGVAAPPPGPAMGFPGPA